MAEYNTQTMRTNLSIWTWDNKENKFYGICVECKGEKAKYTPQVLKSKGIKPCSICTDMKLYNPRTAEDQQS